VAPWPRRIFTGTYRREGSDERVGIPAEIATSYLITMNSLHDLDQPELFERDHGPRIGVLLSDTAMFQRWLPGSEDPEKYDGLQDAPGPQSRRLLDFSPFYGLALPPLFEGQRVVPVQLELLQTDPGLLDEFDVVLASYEFQKPSTTAINDALAGWVRRGGALLYVGDGSDPFHGIRSWWTDRYPTAAHHLAEALGVDHDRDGAVAVGDGLVRFVATDPARFAESPAAAAALVDLVRGLAGLAGHPWRTGSWLSVRRGPYLIGAVLSEATESHTQSGRWVDLLDPELPVITELIVPSGGVVWLRDLDHEPRPGEVLASAGRIDDHSFNADALSYHCEAPAGIGVITALRVAQAPTAVMIDGAASDDWRHDHESGVLWVRHGGAPAGTAVRIVTG
jgi:hypothetical protein